MRREFELQAPGQEPIQAGGDSLWRKLMQKLDWREGYDDSVFHTVQGETVDSARDLLSDDVEIIFGELQEDESLKQEFESSEDEIVFGDLNVLPSSIDNNRRTVRDVMYIGPENSLAS